MPLELKFGNAIILNTSSATLNPWNAFVCTYGPTRLIGKWIWIILLRSTRWQKKNISKEHRNSIGGCLGECSSNVGEGSPCPRRMVRTLTRARRPRPYHGEPPTKNQPRWSVFCCMILAMVVLHTPKGPVISINFFISWISKSFHLTFVRIHRSNVVYALLGLVFFPAP